MEILDAPQPTISRDLAYLRRGGLVAARREGKWMHYRIAPPANPLARLCTGSFCRSQMAEGFLRAYGGDAYDVYSAGTKPSQVNPLAIEVMRELGIDISGHHAKNVTGYLGQHFGTIITVCDNAKEHCPTFPGPAVREHWPFDDSADATGTHEQRIAVFRRVRDEISARIRRFLSQIAHA